MISAKFRPAYSLVLPVLFLNLVRLTVADDTTNKGSQSTESANQLETVHLLLHPAEAPYAALKYRLLPSGIEQTPGNAAPHYFRAAMFILDDKAIQEADVQAATGALSKLDDWLKLPLDQLSKNEEAQKLFNERPIGFWDLVFLAARREQCQWDLPIREFNFATILPELIKLRDIGRLLAFKARIEISRGQIDQAVDTIKTGFAMARHVAQGPTLINGLVGIRIAGFMSDQVRELIQLPNCPNLYWSLSALPSPLIDLRPGLEFERDSLYFFLPELRDVREASHTEAVWDTLLLQVADKLMKVMPGVADSKKNWEWFGQGALFAVTAYPKAKKQLQDAGYTRSQIDAMPASQAILTATVETFNRQHDEMFKWFFAPAPEAFVGLDAAKHQLEGTSEIIPLAALLLPGVAAVKSNEFRSQRDVAALRCLEAMRLYAARHHDQLPQKLSDIKEVPVPNDPMTGQPFSYELNGDRALVTSPVPPGGVASQGLRWEIQVTVGRK
jgi:hypothetical protein